MHKASSALMISLLSGSILIAQSGRTKNYSESTSKETGKAVAEAAADTSQKTDEDVIRVETDLVTIPVRIEERNGRPVPDVRQAEFKIFENGIEQDIAYFSNEDQPFTVALLLDMSYSSVFKLQEIQDAAKLFVSQLRANDKVMVVSFAEKVQVLCEPTDNRKALQLAIEGSRIASGTSLYTALNVAINEKFAKIPGRKAIVLLSDGVDTSSQRITAKKIAYDLAETDILIYPIRYDTFDDVQESRRKDAKVLFDDNDRPYIVDSPRVKGERESDYETAEEFLQQIADTTAGRVHKASSVKNLNKAFARIAEELRKTYSLGYYPIEERRPGAQYALKVRVYRPNLIIRTRERFSSVPR